MFHFLRTFILLLLCPVLHLQAASEWKNPDLQAPEKKRPVPVAKPAPATVPASAPAPLITGQAGLSILRVCDYSLSYVDRGSGGKIDGAFYLPVVPAGYAMIGAYAQGNYHRPTDCITAVKPVSPASQQLLRSPANWDRLWTDKGSGARMDGSVWQPRSDAPDYVCLGSIAHEGYKQPAIANYACVHRCLVENIPVANPVWSTRGTGAKHPVYIYKLHNSNSFYAINTLEAPASLLDIKADTVCTFEN